MNYQHKNLANGGWFELSFPEQMANIGSEVFRTINWKNKGNAEYGKMAFERALELLELTISDERNQKRLRELARLYEALADYFAFDNEYKSSDESWKRYFFAFNYLARLRH